MIKSLILNPWSQGKASPLISFTSFESFDGLAIRAWPSWVIERLHFKAVATQPGLRVAVIKIESERTVF